ncbi:protein translocase subunit SecF [Candidatus Magnetominusculus xianensis]|uniref:Protein-export membrane protein SecF n=1 Tax=Candidatus Magnetominusculus xianensis TaxID=1748249 RepID=A0ABR5SBH7_9BACT|nr:protein translocase subunit SecF [Candidatus Magnetominusculus xianensis]KWT77391.1 preprotein translocase subunit SecF [Candidatus Magnetominusculus xianensis]MBF0405177.1 protein translocase subunit SecF [Nitrospirota bacterium]
MIEIIKRTNIDFMKKRYIAFAVSGVLSLIGILAIVAIARGTANLGIDFAGGTAVQVKFDKAVTLHQVRTALETNGIKGADLQDFPSVKKVMIVLKKAGEHTSSSTSSTASIEKGLSDKVIEALTKGFPDNKIIVDSISEIGPKVGKRLRVDALWAVIASAIGILIYVGWRFQFSFSLGATVATFHDVLAVLGFFYITGLEINLILLTALLTIAGYSLTDTVVVFDRIRENMKVLLKESIDSLINRSINEVLSRTLITSLTVLLASIALFIFGGEVLHDFALAMILGVLVATYSSIFVASPVVLLWSGEKTFTKKH